jgi:hypothetical protein
MSLYQTVNLVSEVAELFNTAILQYANFIFGGLL